MHPTEYEGGQIKRCIRTLFETSRSGHVYDMTHPLRMVVHGVNGGSSKYLNLCKHPDKRGAVILWYEDLK